MSDLAVASSDAGLLFAGQRMAWRNGPTSPYRLVRALPQGEPNGGVVPRMFPFCAFKIA